MARPSNFEKHVISRIYSSSSCNISLGKKLKNKRILFNIDNNALVSIVNKRSSKDKQIMQLM